MSDDKLPRIPSFAELGISEDEIEELEREIAEEVASREADAEGSGEGGAAGLEEPDAESGAFPAGEAPPSGSAAPSRRASAADRTPPPGRTPSARRKQKGARSLFGGRKRRKPERLEMPGERARAAATDPGPAADAGSTSKPTVTPPPWRGARGPVTLLALLVAAWLSSSSHTVPAPVPASAPDTVFSSARAMTHLHRIAAEAHPPGSPAHAGVRDYLLDELRAMGHEPSVQTTTSVTGDGPFLTAATVRNVLARIPGSEPGGRAVLITAHYDSREIARGAGDDGSGVVAILESLRALGAGPQLRNDLIVLFTDAEEPGLLGAHAFVDEHPWMEDVALVLSIEMRGGGGASMMFETGADNGWVIEALRQADPYPSANSVGYEIYQRMPNDTDFTAFREAGRQGLNFAGVGRPHVYHQAYDSPENFSEATLQHHGAHALAMLQHFGAADLTTVTAPDVSYISVRYLGLVTYGRLWIWVLGVVAIALWALTFYVGKRSGSRTSRVLLGCLASLVWLGATGAAAHYLYAWRSAAHLEAGVLHAGSFHSEGWYVLAIVAFAFALATAILPLLRRWFSPLELTVGALLVPTLLAAVTTVMFPMAAVNLQWPVLAGCIGALAVAGLPREGRMGVFRWLVALLAALPVLVVLVPLTENVWLSMGLGLAPVIAVLAGLTFIFVLPLLDVMREPNGWWAPVVGLAATGAFLAVGMSTATPSAERPAPSTLVYALDRETGSAYWGTDPTRDDSDPGVAWAAAAVGPFGAIGAGDAAAAPDTTASPGTANAFDALRVFNTRGVRYALAAADPVHAPPPVVAVVTDTTLSDDLLRVSVTSAIGAEMMLFRFGDDGPRLAALNGKSLASGERPSQVEHWGTAEGGVLLDFVRGPGDEVLRFTVVEHHLRPGDLLGGDHFTRPPELAPNIRMLSDRAMIRTTVSVDGATGEVRIEREAEAGVSQEVPGAEEGPGTEEPPGAEALSADTATAELPPTDTSGTAIPPADTTGTPADTTVLPPDTTGTPVDTTVLPPDTTGTAATPADTTRAANGTPAP